MESSAERGLSRAKRIETPVWLQIPFVIQGPTYVIGAVEIHPLFRYVEVGFEILFRDVHRWHTRKFSHVRRCTGQDIHLSQPVLDQSAQYINDFGALNRQSALSAVLGDIRKDHLVHILIVITDSVQD